MTKRSSHKSVSPFKNSLLEKILSRPTAPFRERHVLAMIETILTAGQVPWFRDPVGNIVVGVAGQKEYRRLIATAGKQKTMEPLRLFIAHLDHPGFHGVRWEADGSLRVKWHGGGPPEHQAGARVWLADAAGWAGEATVREAVIKASTKGPWKMIDELVLHELGAPGLRNTSPTALFGGFAFRAPVWQEGQLIYTKAADDLVGAYVIVQLALDWFAKPSNRHTPPPFLGLLTRAEEVGFIGAIGHLELGWLEQARRPLLGVSLETSRTLPGAEIGKGPVVRLGDRSTVFDAGALKVFSDLALKELPEKHQRRIMDGGACEASAATAWGIPCVGISVPLGNYHNQNYEGGPDAAAPNGPAPEFVHLSDIDGMLRLCRALLKPRLPWSDPWKKRRQDLRKLHRGYRTLMRSGP